jgi:CheY-like chemotaxis protein
MPNAETDAACILIVDDDEIFRSAVAAQLRAAGCRALEAGSYAEGVATIQHHDAIRAVILDHPTINCQVSDVLEALRRNHQEAIVIGNSGEDRRRAFATAGVGHYLQKPWRLPELFSMLCRRIESCIECGRPLPLRLPWPGEQAQSWVCASCGARYRAVRDESAPSDLCTYVISGDGD